ncbi:TIR domain-containing adapter molecule 1 [Fundulus heteroclitus]|uniref:TIR domain-containing adapter molecule 1 n=1 Tax=Fundulus heteroclitus TaxID=8078 RepID=UPI00165C443E|nr:TIR domain-containing adapter molecule 1 [Fundulus heteroclitus]
MNHTELENQETGLRAVFDILVKAPSERLLSLTIQLGQSPEDTIIHALCLIVLQREADALRKLQMLEDNPLANHLAEKWHSGGGSVDEFAAHCGKFEAKTGESLSSLARVFKVLSEQRLCNPLLRDLAYQRALSSGSYCGYQGYDQFREEAKAVCGPQFADCMGTSFDLKSESSLDPARTMDGGSATLKLAVSRDESANVHSLPSLLLESTSEPSYPTHLEISLPPTVSFKEDGAAAGTSGNPTLSPAIHLISGSEKENAPAQLQSTEPQLRSAGASLFGAERDIKTDEASTKRGFQSKEGATKPNAPNTETKSPLPSATHIILPSIPGLKSPHESKGAEEEEEEEEEEMFYAFVILHAPEDSDVADIMREKLEAVIGTTGATFSDDFAVPGKSTLKCVEDAVNNSAFTFLLLTRNFNSRMVEMKTNMALINSINNEHKFNTVIPLLPLDNRMPTQSIPVALQTLVPLEERRNFEKKLQKVFNRAKIDKQRRIWTEEQSLRRLKRLRLRENERLKLHMEQHLVLGGSMPPGEDGGDPRSWWPAQSNIHIENANYVMIGNDSTMTVGVGGSADKDGLR